VGIFCFNYIKQVQIDIAVQLEALHSYKLDHTVRADFGDES